MESSTSIVKVFLGLESIKRTHQMFIVATEMGSKTEKVIYREIL